MPAAKKRKTAKVSQGYRLPAPLVERVARAAITLHVRPCVVAERAIVAGLPAVEMSFPPAA